MTTIFEMQEFIKIIYPNYLQTHLNDVASAVWSSSFFLGEVTGPVIGALLVE